MVTGGTRSGRGGQLVVAAALWLAALPAVANAQFFSNSPSAAPRPPNDVPGVPPGPAQSLFPPSGNIAPRGATPQSPTGAVANPAVQAHAMPVVPPGQGSLALSARFGRDLPIINGSPRLVKEEKGPTPTVVLPPGPYIVSASFGLASVTKTVQVRVETAKDVFEIPAGGLRIEGRVGDARIPPGQISFDLYKGSQF